MIKTHGEHLGVLLLVAALCSSAMATEENARQGRWKADKEINGQKVSMNIEITKDQFVFRMKNDADEVRLFAKGQIKVEKLGPFKTLTLQDIQGGASEDNLQVVDETRAFVYATGWKTLTLAGNFDRERENQEPDLTVYRKE